MSDFNGKAIAVIGTNQCGKTTFAVKKLIGKYKRRVLILMRDDREPIFFRVREITTKELKTFKGVKKLIIRDSKEDLKAIFENYGRGMLVIDDARTITRSRDEELRDIYQKRRQMEIDIVLICHALSEYPPSLWGFTTEAILFRTNENIKRILGSVPFSGHFEKMVAYVNYKAIKNPHFCSVFSFIKPPNFK